MDNSTVTIDKMNALNWVKSGWMAQNECRWLRFKLLAVYYIHSGTGYSLSV